MLYSYGFDTFTHRHTHLKKESSDVETENSEIKLSTYGRLYFSIAKHINNNNNNSFNFQAIIIYWESLFYIIGNFNEAPTSAHTYTHVRTHTSFESNHNFRRLLYIFKFNVRRMLNSAIYRFC